MKTRACLFCKNLTDEPGQLLCRRCIIDYPSPPKRYKILLIDDEIHVLTELKEKLESTLYFEVVTAYDGRKALDKLTYELPKPEIIIVDVNMPVINGPDFVMKLREFDDPEIKNLPVIVLSEKEKAREFFKPWDIQGFLGKPVDMKKLFIALKEIIIK